MNTTINISLSKALYEGVKEVKTQHHYSSVSEVIRDALRNFIKRKRITENGFTEEFEDMVLEAAAEPMDNDIVLETEEDIENYFLHHKLPAKKK